MKWFISLAIAFLLVLAVRQWGIGSYRISTRAMETALLAGDNILVDKWRDMNNPGKLRTILFKSPLLQDSAHVPILAGRCVGMPGDTIEVNELGYSINGDAIPFSPRSLHTYLVTERYREKCLNALQTLKIPLREWTQSNNGHTLRLTSIEAFRVREEMTDEGDPLPLYDPVVRYKLVVPQKGRAYRLDDTSLLACKEAILRETGSQVNFRDGKLFIDGKETTFFFFEQDYYWVLADNPPEGIDSRHLGFIPSDHIIGNAWISWYSLEKERIFKRIR